MKVLWVVLALVLGGCASSPREPVGEKAVAAAPTRDSWSADWVRTFEPLTAGCELDACHSSRDVLGSIPASQTSVPVDVTVQATLQFKAAGAVVSVGLAPTGSPPGTSENVYLRPRNLHLYSPARTTTTLRWVRRNVPASADGYDVNLSIGREGSIAKAVTNVTVTPTD